MNKKAFDRLGRLQAQCATALKTKGQQSLTIWRGDMWAVIGAHHDIQKMRNRKGKPPVPRETP